MDQDTKGTLYIECATGGRRVVMEGCTQREAKQKVWELDGLYDRAEDGDDGSYAKLMRLYPEYYGSHFLFADNEGNEKLFVGLLPHGADEWRTI